MKLELPPISQKSFFFLCTSNIDYFTTQKLTKFVQLWRRQCTAWTQSLHGFLFVLFGFFIYLFEFFSPIPVQSDCIHPGKTQCIKTKAFTNWHR